MRKGGRRKREGGRSAFVATTLTILHRMSSPVLLTGHISSATDLWNWFLQNPNFAPVQQPPFPSSLPLAATLPPSVARSSTVSDSTHKENCAEFG